MRSKGGADAPWDITAALIDISGKGTSRVPGYPMTGWDPSACTFSRCFQTGADQRGRIVWHSGDIACGAGSAPRATSVGTGPSRRVQAWKQRRSSLTMPPRCGARFPLDGLSQLREGQA